jgi:hypothetical protein
MEGEILRNIHCQEFAAVQQRIRLADEMEALEKRIRRIGKCWPGQRVRVRIS